MLLSQHHVPCRMKSIVFSGERQILTSQKSREANDVYFCKSCLSQPSQQKDVQASAYQNPYAVPVQPGRDRAFTIKLALAKSSGRLDLSWMGLESLDPEIFELTDLEVTPYHCLSLALSCGRNIVSYFVYIKQCHPCLHPTTNREEFWSGYWVCTVSSYSIRACDRNFPV